MSEIVQKQQPAEKPLKTDNDSDSLSSAFFTTWQPKHKPPPPNSIQTGHMVAASEFYLFFSSVLLLTLSSGLIAMSLWNIVFKLPFTVLIETSTELASFTLPGAILCLPCFWIVLSVHNEPKSYRFLSLVMLLLTFASLLMMIAIYLGFTHKLRAVDDATLKESEFRPTMWTSLRMYEKNEKTRKAWDRIQSTWSCCGVDNFSDWFPVRTRFPESCCNARVVCSGNSTSSHGCLKVIITVLSLQTRLFNGICCVALFIMCCTLITVASAYFSHRNSQQE